MRGTIIALQWRSRLPPSARAGRRTSKAPMPSRCPTPRSSRISIALRADKVYLVGFMGAGKSSVARALGKRLDWRVEDIDERIERAERRDIPTIFRDTGEP